MDLTNSTYQALLGYFNALTNMGYMKYSNVDKLLMLTYILEINKNQLSPEDYVTIDKALSCLQGSACMIPDNLKSACN